MGNWPENAWDRQSPEIRAAIHAALDRAIWPWFSHPEGSVFFESVPISEMEFAKRHKRHFLDFFYFFLTEEMRDTTTGATVPLENPLVPFLNLLHIRDIAVEDLLSMIHVYKNIFIRNAFFSDDAAGVFPDIGWEEKWKINTDFDKAVENLIKLYSQGSKIFLKGYKKAFDYGSINSITDPKGIILYANDAFCQLSEYAKDELVGKPHNIVRHPDMPKEVFKDMWDTILAKKSWQGIIKNRKKWGGHYWVKALVMPILNLHGEISEFISMRIDITELKEVQDELTQALEKLKELDRQKTEFYNIANHELRTPMTAILGFVSMMLDGDAGEINDRVREYLEQVSASSKQLLDIINEMLDIAKLESWEVKLFPERSDIGALIGEAVNGLRSIVHGKAQKLELDIGFDACYADIDRVKFKQVIVNIVGNAIKYTPDGWSIFVSATSDGSVFRVVVRDTGVGIPEKYLGSIFEKFSQVKVASTRDIAGTGLGLAITKKIIEAFHGTVGVTSVEGKWSTFTVEIPIVAEKTFRNNPTELTDGFQGE